MSRKSSPHSPWSWLDAVADLFGTPTRKASGRNPDRRRTLRLEPLESRSLLSVNVLGAVSGVVFYDPTGAGLTAGDTRLAGVTVELWRDGGNGVFDNGAGDDTLVGTAVTDAAGNYRFNSLSAGTYFVQQLPTSGYVLGSGQNVATVTITPAALQGVTGLVIDSFSTTMQAANAAYPSGATGVSYATASEAIGGARDMSVQLTSTHGSVSLGVDSTTPDALDFSTGPGAIGTGYIIWQGQATGAYATQFGDLRNATGLNGADLTSSGASTGIKLSLGGDHTGTAVLTIYTDASDWSSATITIPDTTDGTATQDVFVPFSSFIVGGGSGATFTNAGAIKLSLTGPAAMDAQVANIDAIGPTVMVHNFANTAQTDLAIVKTGDPNPVDAGKPLTYTLTATNNGPSNGTGVTVVDTLPTGVTYASSTTTQGTVSVNGNVVTTTLGNLANGASATITILVNVNSATTGDITNTATITGVETDPNLANNTATCTTTVDQVQHTESVPDLAIVKSYSPHSVYAGATFTYTLNISNSGGAFPGVTVSDPLPTGETLVSVSASQGTTSVSNRTITANLGDMADQGTATVTIVVKATAPAGTTLTNTASVSGNLTDPTPDDNQSTVNTLILASPSKRHYLGR